MIVLAVAGVATGQKPTVDGVDLDAAYANLKTSEGKKDYDGVLKWSGVTSEIARKTIAAPKAEGQSDEDFKQAVDYARQVDVYTEYSLYAMMLQEPDPQKAMKLADTLEAAQPEKPIHRHGHAALLRRRPAGECVAGRSRLRRARLRTRSVLGRHAPGDGRLLHATEEDSR